MTREEWKTFLGWAFDATENLPKGKQGPMQDFIGRLERCSVVEWQTGEPVPTDDEEDCREILFNASGTVSPALACFEDRTEGDPLMGEHVVDYAVDFSSCSGCLLDPPESWAELPWPPEE
jgi:hypothetical protein